MKTRLALALMVIVTATAAQAQKVNVDQDSAAPFGTYRTYAWVDGTPAPNPLNEQRIHAGVEANMAGRGLMKASANPDIIVATHVTTMERQNLIANGFGYGPWGYGGGFGGATVETYIEGTLIVDLYDAKTKKMVWRGVATATASDKPSKNAEKINKALAKMFEKYPTTFVPSH